MTIPSHPSPGTRRLYKLGWEPVGVYHGDSVCQDSITALKLRVQTLPEFLDLPSLSTLTLSTALPPDTDLSIRLFVPFLCGLYLVNKKPPILHTVPVTTLHLPSSSRPHNGRSKVRYGLRQIRASRQLAQFFASSESIRQSQIGASRDTNQFCNTVTRGIVSRQKPHTPDTRGRNLKKIQSFLLLRGSSCGKSLQRPLQT